MENLEQKDFRVTGMSCSHCKSRVSDAVKQIDGVIEVNVFLENKNVVIQFDKTKTNIAALTAAINAAGYQVEN